MIILIITIIIIIIITIIIIIVIVIVNIIIIIVRGVFEPKVLGQQAKSVSQQDLSPNDFTITYEAYYATK